MVRPAVLYFHWFEPRKFLQKWVESITLEGMDQEAQLVHGRSELGVFWEQEARAPTVDVCRNHGISGATLLQMQGQVGCLEVSERLMALRTRTQVPS